MKKLIAIFTSLLVAFTVYAFPPVPIVSPTGSAVITTVGSTRAITTDEVRGNKLNFTGAYTGTLPTAVVGMSFEAISSTAAVYSLDVQAGDHWDVAGASLPNGNKITSDGTKQAWLKATCYTANVWTLESSNFTPIDGGS